MTKNLTLAAACAVLALVCWWATPSPVAAQANAPAKNVVWQYKFAEMNEAELNKLGDDGWEAVGTTTEIHSRVGGGKARTLQDVSSNVRVLLKRVKQ